MLGSMQRFARHSIVKFFLIGLVATFAVWGVGDMLRTSNSPVATIGGEEVSQFEFSTILRNEVQRMQPYFDQVINDEIIERTRLRDRALENIIDKKLAVLRVNDLNIHVGEDAVESYIVANGLFMDDNDVFSQEKFSSFLRANSLSEKRYLNFVRSDMNRRLLFETLAAALPSFDVHAKWLYKQRAQKRLVDVVTIPSDFVANVKDPSETDLRQYYQENVDEFTVEEMKGASFFSFNRDSVRKEAHVSEADLEEYYQQQRFEYVSPEKRSVSQYVFSSEEEARAAYQSLLVGGAIEKEKVSLGDVTQEDLPDSAQDKVFSLEVGQYSEPVQTGLGWHVFVVSKVKEESLTPFKEVKADIEKALIEDKVEVLFQDLINRIEDDIASGLSLEEMAEKYEMKAKQLEAFDYWGRGADGGYSLRKLVPDEKVFAETMFHLEDEEISLFLANDSYLVVSIDRTYPKRVKALDEAKGTAIENWKKAEIVRLVEEGAGELIRKAREKKSLAAVATGRIKLRRNQKISRDEKGEPIQRISEDFFIPPGLISEAFNLEVGEISSSYRDVRGNVLIAQVKKVLEGDLQKRESEQLQYAIEGELEQSFIDDITSQYFTYLRNLYPIEVNEPLVKTVR